MLAGIICGLLAGAVWGFPFLVPIVLKDYSPLQIMEGRFFFYGILSLGYLLTRPQQFKKLLNKQILMIALTLSMIGYSLYYFLLVYSIQLIGAPLASLVLGLIPVLVALLGRSEVNSKRLFWLSLLLIFTGLIVLNIQVFLDLKSNSTQTGWSFLGGVLASVFATLSWSIYAVYNSKALKLYTQIKSLDWTNLLGLMAFLSLFILHLPLNSLMSQHNYRPWQEMGENPTFLFWTAVLGIVSAWGGGLLWNFASRRLPTSLLGQLLVSETFFALLYSYIYFEKWPRWQEALALVLFLGGVSLGIQCFQPRKTQEHLAEEAHF